MSRLLLQEVVSAVSASYSRSALWRSSEAMVVRLQAAARGFLLRQQLEARQRYLMAHTPAVITIQVRVQIHDFWICLALPVWTQWFL